MDLKVLPRSCRGYRYILCVIDKVTNYIITAPIKQSRSEEVGEALINSVFSKYCIPDYMLPIGFIYILTLCYLYYI